MWSSSNHNKMGSNVNTTGKQGGGNMKAGFPYQIGRTQWTNVFMGLEMQSGQCCTLTKTNDTIFKIAHQSRPIGSNSNVARSYWNVV
jgi:hypothetical protein